MDTQTIDDKISCKIKISKFCKNCPKTNNGWFACYADVYSADTYNLPDNIKIYGFANQIPVPISNKTTNLQLEVIITKSSKYTDGYNLVLAEVSTKTKTGIVSYLSSLKGVSKAVAKRVVDYYGTKTIEMIQNEPDKIKDELSLKTKQINALHDGVVEANLINTIRKLAPELTASHTIAIKNAFKNPVSIIKNDTYRLYTDADIPFNIVDTIALRMNPNPTNIKRICIGIYHCVKSYVASTHNLFVNLSDDTEFYRLINEVSALLNISFGDIGFEQNFANYIMMASNDPKYKLVIDQYNNETHLYTSQIYTAMTSIVKHFKNVAQRTSYYSSFKYVTNYHNGQISAAINASITNWETKANMNLTKEQYKAVKTALTNPCSVITGGPGRGKTCVIDCIAACWNGPVKLLAPTGKAMNKLRTATNFAYSTETIDKLLCREILRKKNAITFDDPAEINNNEKTLVIIDESSMIDIVKAYELLTIIGKCQIIFVGDIDQLPPISPGYFLKDIIDSKCVPISYLTKPLRNGGLILANADKINANDTNLQYNIKEMPFYPQAKEDQSALDFILDQYNDERVDCPDITQIALLCPVRKGAVGVIAMNLALQNITCPVNNVPNEKRDMNHGGILINTSKGYPIPGTIYGNSYKYTNFRIGDIVMNTKNMNCIQTYNYTNDDYFNGTADSTSMGIFNGDCGRIIAYIPQQADPSGDDEDYHNSVVIQFFDNRFAILDIDLEELKSFDLGYAMTVHKSQGCEYETVICVIPESLSSQYNIDNGFTCKNLLYTAVTRAKNRVVLIGSKDGVNDCITHNIPVKNSNLAERLK